MQYKINVAGLILFACGILISCKKSAVTPQGNGVPISPTTGTRTQLTLDSIYLYALQTYLWNDQLPSYTTFNPRQYTTEGDDLDNFKTELFALSQLPIDPSTELPYEAPVGPGSPKYSFIQSGNASPASIASVDVQGNGNDLGLQLAASGDQIYIEFVYPGSPADKAGLTRGELVETINGQPAQALYTLYVLDEPSLILGVKNSSGQSIIVNLTSTTYSTNPVFKQTVLHAGSGTIAYLALSEFYSLASAKTALDNAFSVFASAKCTDLIIDLRYNGGGYIETAEYVANLAATSALTGQIMYSENFNDLMQQGKATILKNQPYLDANNQPVFINGRKATMDDVDFSVSGNTFKFSKAGSLQSIKNVFFIVSGNTASASELLINCLKPYFNVKLIGSTTYGKPVGFFGINIDKYSVFMSNFQIKNSAGSGDYFSGFVPDISADDDITHDFGDPEETCLKSAIAALTTPGVKGTTNSLLLKNESSFYRTSTRPNVKSNTARPLFNQMIETRHKLRKSTN